MNVRELRLGNLVRYHDMTTVDIEVDIEDLILIKEQLDGCTYSPIPITEEWLLKFGFQKLPLPYQGEYFYRLPNGFEVMSLGGKIHRIIVFKGAIGYSLQGGNGIDYVHQLQNLYYALTDEELKMATVEQN